MPRTYFFKVTVPSLYSVEILPLNHKRVGLTIINRSLTANQLFLGFTPNLMASGLPYNNTILLNQNDSVTLLKSEGDDCTKAIFGIGFALGYVDVIETEGD